MSGQKTAWAFAFGFQLGSRKMRVESPQNSPRTEPLLTLKEAAEALGLPYFKIQRAVRAGLLPTYKIYNSRRLIRLSEVIMVVEGSRQGGRK
jgi:excisionase family DNA binding protein